MSDPSPPPGPAQGPRPPAWNRPQPPPPPAAPAPPLPAAPRSVPTGGYGVPPGPQVPLARRIPDNLPFVARPSGVKRALVLVPIGLLALFIIGCPATLVLTADGPDHTSGDIVALVAMLACLAIVLAGVIVLQIFLVTSGGPVLAAGPAGLWIKTRPTRGQAIWLPWEAVEQVRRRRWMLEKMVVVKPRDPRIEGNLGVFTAIDSAALKLFYGSGFTATLNFADRSEDEILAALREYSAGRTAFNI
ncbi:hypothetical protein [Dactylosporangium sp. CA-092794]|uniref:hypothetical protein n=1 Tax=Dactylosporangium sp. CA-092794 TaxID=3239929 RepID=UPI003D926F5D